MDWHDACLAWSQRTGASKIDISIELANLIKNTTVIVNIVSISYIGTQSYL